MDAGDKNPQVAVPISRLIIPLFAYILSMDGCR